jgi:hypothetical protein
MTKLLRRALLVSSTALIAITFVPTLGAMLPGSLAALITDEAQARGGDDDGGDDSGSESDDSGRDSASDRDDSDDDSSGRDRDRDRSSDDDDSNDDRSGRGSDDDSIDDDGDDNRRGRGGDRDEIRLIVNENQLAGLLSGSMIPVDQNGKRLRFEVEREDGNTEIKLRAPRGTLTGVTVIPAP